MELSHKPSLLAEEERFQVKLNAREQLLVTLEDKVDEARTHLHSARTRLSSLSLNLHQLDERRTKLQNDLNETQGIVPLTTAWSVLELGLLVSAFSFLFALISLVS